MNFKKRNKTISIVDSEMLYLVEIDPHGEKKAVNIVTLDNLLKDDSHAELIPISIKDQVNTLLIVPDYWFENSVYQFQSKNKSLADTFVERKLKAQFPQQPLISYFFDYIFYQRGDEKQWIYAYYLKDPQFFQLYEALSKLNLTPHQITSPAFIWKQKIQQEISDFNKSGSCFIQLLPNIYHLYFYFEGNFLFSRSIPVTDVQTCTSDNIEAITYELNQSLYLFSQRAKAEAEKLYILSFESESITHLSEALGREITDLSSVLNDPRDMCVADAPSEPMGYHLLFPLLLKKNFLVVSHKKLKKELAWKPVQSAGMIIGLLLFLLLGLESIFLYKFSYQNQAPSIGGSPLFSWETNQKIRQYNEALDVFLEEAKRHSPKEVLAKVAGSLPLDVQMQELVFESETNPGVKFKGLLKNLGPDYLKKSLSVLITNFNKNLQPSKALTMADIDFDLDKNKQNYFIIFRVEL